MKRKFESCRNFDISRVCCSVIIIVNGSARFVAKMKGVKFATTRVVATRVSMIMCEVAMPIMELQH